MFEHLRYGRALLVLLLLLATAGCTARRDPAELLPGGSAGQGAAATELAPPIPPPPAGTEQGPGLPLPPDVDSLGLSDRDAGIEALPGNDVWVNADLAAGDQQETAIAADPTDALNLVGVYQIFNVFRSWSTDGGASWQSAEFVHPDGYFDPAVDVDGQGNFYITMVARDEVGFSTEVVISKSTDDGATFSTPTAVNPGGTSSDKPFLAIDRTNDDIYVVWIEVPGGVRTLYFAKSTDGGATFSSKLQISSIASEGNGAVPAVGPNGEIYVVWGMSNANTIWFDRSLDGGTTWVDPDIAIDAYVPPRSPLAGNFRNPAVPAIAVDRSGGAFHGRVYVVWPDQRFGDPDILLSFSDDSGSSWSPAVRVNDDITGNDADQWFPWLTVDDNGHVHVTFLDRREDPDGLLFRAYLATSTDGGLSFGPNIRVSDGLYGPTDNEFLGDYTGAAVSADHRIHPLWPDGRNGELDIFTRSVDLADYDEDGVLNDGDLDGQYASNRCTGGQSAGCDDNCPGSPNPEQADGEGDLVGDTCDNCAAMANTDQHDRDRDGIGDACDPCPDRVGGDANDPDQDGRANCIDNCPSHVNPDQSDLDGDGLGDPCDPYPDEADNDGVDPATDNCPQSFNPEQRDTDQDGVGDVCDVCPGDQDADQADTDGDGAGDACDCQPGDPNDRQPGETRALRLDKIGAQDARLIWQAAPGADTHSISRVALSALRAGQYGECLTEGLTATSFDDGDPLAAGQGVAYLVQAHNYDCGLGPLGRDSTEQLRENTDPAACVGAAHLDAHPQGETPGQGTVSGSYLDTLASDDVYETITEVPAGSFQVLEHRWSFNVGPGSLIELHVEGFQSDAEEMLWSWSDNGGAQWNFFTAPALPLADDDTDRIAPLPATLSGAVLIRIQDRTRFVIEPVATSVSLDELFIRSID